jgi:hypothetical protein
MSTLDQLKALLQIALSMLAYFTGAVATSVTEKLEWRQNFEKWSFQPVLESQRIGAHGVLDKAQQLT